MTDKKNIVHQCFILADANSNIGTGHVMRTFIIAQQLKILNIEVSYLLADTSEKIKKWLAEQGQFFYELTPAIRNTASELIHFLAKIRKGKQLLLLDSDEPSIYNINYQKELRNSALGLALITMRNHPFNLDILHNQNPLALVSNYQINSDAKQLLGLNYLIVKDQYKDVFQQSVHKKIANIKTLLLTFGGADSKGLTVRMLNILNNLPKAFAFNIHVIVGALNKDINTIHELTKDTQHTYTVYQNTPKMPELMFESDLSINSGGLTVWELAICKTLNFVIPTSEREIKTADYLKTQSLIYTEGAFDQLEDSIIANKIKSICSSINEAQKMCDKFYKIVNPSGADLFTNEIIKWFQI